MIRRNFRKKLKRINTNISIKMCRTKCTNINKLNNNKLKNGISNFKDHSIILL